MLVTLTLQKLQAALPIACCLAASCLLRRAARCPPTYGERPFAPGGRECPWTMPHRSVRLQRVEITIQALVGALSPAQ